MLSSQRTNHMLHQLTHYVDITACGVVGVLEHYHVAHFLVGGNAKHLLSGSLQIIHCHFLICSDIMGNGTGIGGL